MFSAVAALLLLKAAQAQERYAMRVASIRQRAGIPSVISSPSRSTILRMVSSIGIIIARSGALSQNTLSELQQTLVVAGFRDSNGLSLFVGSKLVLLALLPLLAWFAFGYFGVSPLIHNCGTLFCAIFGLLGPDFVIKRIHAAYLARLDQGLPDALDMLVICSEAGLGLEPSITRVALEIVHTHPAVSTELLQTASELRVISDRRLALRNMGTRTGLESLRRLGATLVQTSQYGTPVSHALRTLSAEMRTEMLTKFEERARSAASAAHCTNDCLYPTNCLRRRWRTGNAAGHFHPSSLIPMETAKMRLVIIACLFVLEACTAPTDQLAQQAAKPKGWCCCTSGWGSGRCIVNCPAAACSKSRQCLSTPHSGSSVDRAWRVGSSGRKLSAGGSSSAQFGSSNLWPGSRAACERRCGCG